MSEAELPPITPAPFISNAMGRKDIHLAPIKTPTFSLKRAVAAGRLSSPVGAAVSASGAVAGVGSGGGGPAPKKRKLTGAAAMAARRAANAKAAAAAAASAARSQFEGELRVICFLSIGSSKFLEDIPQKRYRYPGDSAQLKGALLCEVDHGLSLHTMVLGVDVDLLV